MTLAAGLGLVRAAAQFGLDIGGRVGDGVDEAPQPLMGPELGQPLAADHQQPHQLAAVRAQDQPEPLNVFPA